MSKYEILQQNKLSEELQKKRSLTAEWYRFKKKEKMLQGIAFDGAGFLVGLLFIGLVAYVGFQLMEGRYQYADFVAITGLGIVFIKDLDDLLMQIRRMIDRHIDIKKIWELVDDLDTGFDVQQGLPFVFKQGNIVFDQVSYAYPGKLPVFSGFSLSIAGNKKTALVGPSGGGKSTLLKLLAGYLRSSDGMVAVDGQHINEVSLLSYYAHIGYLTQEPNVFDGTIRENLLYGVKEGQYREDDIASYVDKVLSMAKCEWVYDLPQGLDTEIGERGVRLSGGQRQRLAIAKIFLKDPQIVLLDEPTSALDSFSEEAITEAMQNLFAGRTVIIVAHRLQTVKSADEIIFIDEGQVVERGTHGELIALGGRYAKMLELQSGF